MKFGDRYIKFMKDRYGIDELYKFLLLICFVLIVINTFISNNIIRLFEVLLIVIIFYRYMSKNIKLRKKALYHADAAAQTVVRTVLRGVCWQQGRRELPDAGGTRRGAALLVVIPETTARYGADYTLAPGDRLFPGEGPALTWADWPGFVPAAVEGAALVQYVLPMRLRGKPHHVEAGAWWNGSGTGVRSLTR